MNNIKQQFFFEECNQISKCQCLSTVSLQERTTRKYLLNLVPMNNLLLKMGIKCLLVNALLQKSQFLGKLQKHVNRGTFSVTINMLCSM